MQSIKLVVRQIGVPNPALDIFSAEEASQYIQYQYGSQGYILQGSHYLGEVKDQGGTAGYRVMFVLVKNDEPEAAKAKKNA